MLLSIATCSSALTDALPRSAAGSGYAGSTQPLGALSLRPRLHRHARSLTEGTVDKHAYNDDDDGDDTAEETRVCKLMESTIMMLKPMRALLPLKTLTINLCFACHATTCGVSAGLIKKHSKFSKSTLNHQGPLFTEPPKWKACPILLLPLAQVGF